MSRLEDLFNIVKAEEAAKKLVPVIPDQAAENIEEIDKEHAYVQDKLKTFVETGEAVLEEAKNVAIQASSEPETIKAFAQLLKEVSGTAKMLMDTLDLKKKLKRDDKKAEELSKDMPNTVTNNTQIVFTSSPGDLIEHVKKPIIDV